jgi:hypothetical protein
MATSSWLLAASLTPVCVRCHHAGCVITRRRRAVFGYIDDLNGAIATARASGGPALRAAVKGRRLVGPASCQLIRATLR